MVSNVSSYHHNFQISQPVSCYGNFDILLSYESNNDMETYIIWEREGSIFVNMHFLRLDRNVHKIETLRV